MKHRINVQLKTMAVFIAIVFVIISIGYSLLGGKTYSKVKLGILDYMVKHQYLGELNTENLYDGILQGYMAGLDSDMSMYLNKEEYMAHEAMDKGQEVSTGIKYTWGIDNNYLIITEIIPDSPASRAGLSVGDKIIEVDGMKVIAANSSQIGAKLAYTVGEIHYLVTSNDDSNEREVTLTPELVEEESFAIEFIDSVAYIKVKTIKEGTTIELEKTIRDLDSSTKGIILDIRNLYSNNIDEVYALCKLFGQEGIAFKLESKNQGIREFHVEEANKINLPVIVLINSGTRGVIEALPAAIKGDITLIGNKTAGIGEKTELFQLEDGTGIRLAIGYIYDRAGNSLAEDGIEPDEVIGHSEENILQIRIYGQLNPLEDTQFLAALKKFQ